MIKYHVPEYGICMATNNRNATPVSLPVATCHH